MTRDEAMAEIAAAQAAGRKANLSNADLFEANLRRANLSNADLFEANLRRANLSRTYGYNQQTEG